MSHTFRFIGQRDAAGQWTVTGDELHHLAKVLRLSEGEAIEITDGAGRVATGTIQSIASKTAVLDLGQEVTVPAPKWPVRMLLGALKPGSFDDLLPDLIELGVDHVDVFVHQGDAKSRIAESAVARWQRIIVQAVKQSKRAYVPTLAVHDTLFQCLTVMPSPKGVGHPLVVLAPDSSQPMPTVIATASSGMTIACGGEKGMNDEELRDLKRAGFVPTLLTKSILRATTAAVAAATLACVARDKL